jgi:hypothetical protein
MSIIFDPADRLFQINENKWKSNSYENIDLYKIDINNGKDMEILNLLNQKTYDENIKISTKNRYGYFYDVKYDKETKKFSNAFDFDFFNYEIQQNLDLNFSCIDIYKKYIEKYILLRANKMENINYLFDIYIMINNKECENICKKFAEIFDKLLDCANIRLHFMYIELKDTNYLYDYSKSCSIA